MPRGAPDYSNVQVESPLHRVTDLAELAARMGSPVTYSRSGSVVWITDFDDGMQGTTCTSDHADSTGALSTERVCQGRFSLKLDPRAAADSYVRYSRVIGLLEPTMIGFEASFSLDDDPDAVRLTMWYRDGTNELYAPVVYETDGGLWKVRDADAGWVTVLSGFTLLPGNNAWHTVKLVIDTENETYAWLQAGKHSIGLSDYSLLKSASADPGQVYFRVTVYGTVADNAPVWVDNIIITQNEQ